MGHGDAAASRCKPQFVSVTYGAGGSTRERTARTVKRILTETRLTPAAHLTCVDATREEVDAGDRRIRWHGRRSASSRCAAIRPQASARATGRIRAATPTAPNWSAALKASGDFDISVSAYPEKHPESPDFATDIDMLKRKVDNGATRAITQFFFDNDLYERYVERVRRAGIYIPIVPGILPVHNFAQVANFSRALRRACAGLAGRALRRAGERPADACAGGVGGGGRAGLDLVERGVGDFHFYTMNRADLVFAICHMIGIRADACEPAAGAASAAA